MFHGRNGRIYINLKMLFAPEQSFRNLTCLLLEGGARNDAEYAFFSKLHYAKL